MLNAVTKRWEDQSTTRFCSACGAKLPAAIEEEKAQAGKNADVLAKWEEKLSEYPVWNCGGTDFERL